MKKKISIVISIVMLFTMMNLTAYADEVSIPESKPVIASFMALDEAVVQQELVAYSDSSAVLPEQLEAVLETGESAMIEAEWLPDKEFDITISGEYIFNPVIDDAYEIGEGVQLPVIKVNVSKCETKITYVDKTLSYKSRGEAYDTVTVINGYGRILKLQMWNGKNWVTKKSIQLENTSSQRIKVIYTNDWWKVTTSKWRHVIEENDGAQQFISITTELKTKRYYQNPSKYIQIQDKITIDNSGAYTLKLGYMGLKTRQVNRYFGIGSKYWPRYTSTTKAKVKNFQKKKGLKVTGNVNKATWLKMGYSEKSWKNMGAYVSPIKVNPSSTKKQHIEAMIDRAYDYLGSDYVVGASGTPSQGADCSGLVMQALYASGIEIPGINPVTHAKAGHEYESRNMWNKADFKKVSYKNRKRGDLIFYHNGYGTVIHVAIYLGNNKVIEAWPNKARIAKVKHHPIKGVMRVFN